MSFKDTKVLLKVQFRFIGRNNTVNEHVCLCMLYIGISKQYYIEKQKQLVK